MKPRDIEIWERFISQTPNAFDKVEYDVHVGDPRDNDEELSPAMERDRQALGKRKIDVVGFRDDVIFIIEIKPNAGASALGQSIMYDFLYTRDYAPQGPTVAMILTDIATPNLADLTLEHNITLIEVGIK